MKISLTEEPKEVTLVQGFPGFGMVGSIATEFLLEHLDVRSIGTITLEELPPIVAIHKGNIVPPVGLYYNEKYNLVILNFLTKSGDSEWLFADIVQELMKRLDVKEVISLEGVAGKSEDDKKYAFSKNEDRMNRLQQIGFEKLNESIIMGVSAALFLHNVDLTAFFAMTESTLPDSNAAAELIKSLDSYLGLEVDSTPLNEQAKLFENKIKNILAKSHEVSSEKEKSMLNYLG